ncbi:MAG: hypothetical protein ACHQXA_05380 [Gemmatimonadales bacterium]
MSTISSRTPALGLTLVVTLLAACQLDKLVDAPTGRGPGTPTDVHLAFLTTPPSTVAGSAITPAVRIAAEDATGHPIEAFSGTITVALGSGPAGSSLSGTRSVTPNAGIATFPDLSISKAGTGYTLTASASGASGATSTQFAVEPGPAVRLRFTVQPSDATTGNDIRPAVQVSAYDAFDNSVGGFSGAVTVALGHDGSVLGNARLSGSTSVAAVSGVATFSTLSLDEAGSGYTLTAAFTSGPPAVTSAPFSVALTLGPPPATALAFVSQPGPTTAGSPLAPGIQVAARDSTGHTVVGYTGAVTVTLAGNSGGGVLFGTRTVSAVNGIATFSDLSLEKAAAGFTLAASAVGLSGTTSSPFVVSPGTATQLVFSVQPSAAGLLSTIQPPVGVLAYDSWGNLAIGFTGPIHVALGRDVSLLGNAHLSGTVVVQAIAGAAMFSDLYVDEIGAGYTLTAALGQGPPAVESAPFSVLVL